MRNISLGKLSSQWYFVMVAPANWENREHILVQNHMIKGEMLHQNPPSLRKFLMAYRTSQVISIIKKKKNTFIISISVVLSNLKKVFNNINRKALQGVFLWLQQLPNLTSVLCLLHNDAFTTGHWSGHLLPTAPTKKPNLHTKVFLKISSQSSIFGFLTHFNQSKSITNTSFQRYHDASHLHTWTDHLEKF